MQAADLQEKLKQYSFYHTIDLGDGISTPGVREFFAQQQFTLRALHGIDLKGRSVLDIGCADGLFALEAEKLGASRVLAIDNDLSATAVNFLLPYFQSKIEMRQENLLNLTPEKFGRFDIVIFVGVLYHTRYPFHTLRIIREMLNPGGLLLLETAILNAWESTPLLYCPSSRESPYVETSVSFFNHHGISSTLRSLGFESHMVGRLFTLRNCWSLPGINWKHWIYALIIVVQRLVPAVAALLLRRFAIQRRSMLAD